ncbi:hypothetical protein TBLA_0H01400 [Henningerozyma blattae CBS 6284]|uniref:AB hydrolase-1 domain-containing protein n=1 Tax=Henningerozyma blattae (strain ATCC 34711 / CBS 6284 / DSM 70876 / NBRC 10599 / NRRL Y-10934 / UCD 77-7) TaxID=1071380 RepID=I2H7S5_HENB6|nr:hypothetical protein TBLA_0H01400 [Tetrapisispora blattae CBS 6284]CCH62427.1 hypothetical protein TBLA_0H01400 [Tetrapisispora blattae CBS 6284]
MKSQSNIQTLTDLQSKVMDDISISGTMDNSMAFNEINQWHFHNANASTIKTPTVLIHGYAASSMAYYKTFRYLTGSIKDLYTIDLPGFGLSASPKIIINDHNRKKSQFDIKLIDSKDSNNNKFSISKKNLKLLENGNIEDKAFISAFDDYYIDRIEKWRKFNNLGKINVIGHSFGGYISFKYAIKYPDSIENLCLVSPFGMESNVYSINNYDDWKEKFSNPSSTRTSSVSSLGSSNSILNDSGTKIFKTNSDTDTQLELDLVDPTSKYYFREKVVPGVLFNNQFNVLKCMGPLGSKLTWSFISRRYEHIASEAYQNFLFKLFATVPNVTINNFSNMFTRNLLAKDPIMDSINKLQSKKLLLFYGENDWMNKEAGFLMAEKLNILKGDSKYANWIEVPNSGHNLILDDPKFFSKNLIDFLSS